MYKTFGLKGHILNCNMLLYAAQSITLCKKNMTL